MRGLLKRTRGDADNTYAAPIGAAVWLTIAPGRYKEGLLVTARHQENFARVPWSLARLPPFPLVATRVLHLVAKNDSSLHQLSALISTDQAFSSEILTIVNSPIFPIHTTVTSIQQGIAALGLERVKGLAVTVGFERISAAR